MILGAREAEAWFCSDDSRWLFSFLPICDALGLEPRYIRLKLKHWSPVPTRHDACHEVKLIARVNRGGFATQQ